MSLIFTKHFSILLRPKRVSLGLTQVEISEKANISLRSYQRIELGESCPSLDALFHISKILQIDLVEILNLSNDSSENKDILLRSMKFLELTAQSAVIGSWIFDSSSNILHWSHVSKQIYEVDEFFIPTVESLKYFHRHNNKTATLHDLVQGLLLTGLPFNREYEIQLPSGAKKTILARGQMDNCPDSKNQYFGTIQDITQLKILEGKTQNTLAELDEMQSLAKLGQWKRHLSTNKTEWTHITFEILELDSSLVVPSYEVFLDLVHPDDRNIVMEAYRNFVSNGKSYEIEHRLKMKDGRVKWVFGKIMWKYDKYGMPNASIGYIQDITKQKRSEEILQKTLLELEKTQSLAQIGQWKRNLITNKVEWSQSIFDIFELDSSLVNPSYEAFLDIVHPDDRAAVSEARNEFTMTGNSDQFEYRLKMKDGRIKWIQRRTVNLFDEQGKPNLLIGYNQDITQQKMAEVNLQKILNELEEIQSLAQIGQWKRNLLTNKIEWTKSIFEIYELDASLVIPSYEIFLDLVHPDDRSSVVEAYSNFLETGKSFEIEYRLIMKDGRVKWVLGRAMRQFNEHGTIITSSGYIQDITRFKK